MKVKMFSFLALIGLTVGISQSALARESFPIAFRVSDGSGHTLSESNNPLLESARSAFEALYGQEEGFLYTQHSGDNQTLFIYMSSQQSMNRLWRTMLDAGTASYSGGKGYFHYDTGPNPMSEYRYWGQVGLYEGESTTFNLPGTSEFVTNYQLRFERGCNIVRSGVQSHETLIPTRLIKRDNYYSYSMAYTYAVNGGRGANIYGITIQTARDSWFVTDHCPIQIWVK